MNRFRKNERITSQKTIDLLFGGSQSKSFVAFPIRVVWMVGREATDTMAPELSEDSEGSESSEDSESSESSKRSERCEHTPGSPVQVLMSVPKKRLRHAVDRNRAKRQLREAYRQRSRLLKEALPPGSTLHMAFIWLADRPEPSALVSGRMEKLLHRIAESIV